MCLRLALVLMLASTAWACGCGPSAVPSVPSDPPPTGQAAWTDGCLRNACNSAGHYIRRDEDSPTVAVECSLMPWMNGYTVSFSIATVSGWQRDLRYSREALSVRGFLPAVGQEIGPVFEDYGYVRVRGNGWWASGPVGVTNLCHVFIDRLADGGFSGRLNCEGMRDDATPPNARFVRGDANAMNSNFGEFVFNNCATLPYRR